MKYLFCLFSFFSIVPVFSQSQLRVLGLSQPVDIKVDPFGVPHIYAKNENDMFFAQGFQAASDRLFQFEIWRRQARGLISEILGEREIKKDIGLPDDWKMDNIVKEAIEFYSKMSITPTAKLYKSALKAADDIAKYLEMTDILLAERTDKGSVVTPLS